MMNLIENIPLNTKITNVLIALLFAFSPIHAQQTINGTIQHDGLTREYILYVPNSYNPNESTPLVLSFHGYTSNAKSNFNYTKFKSIADTAGFILIHPQGSVYNGATHWNVGGWTLGSTVDDVGFVSELLDSISNSHNIDQDRIYSTGMSNGGYMSFLLACQLSNRIAAVASVTGSMTPQIYDNCDPQHPTPILQIHGTADGTVPYNGDPLWTKSIDEVLDYWVNFNHCNSNSSVTKVPDINTGDGSTVDHIRYYEGDNCVSTEHFKVYNGDHDWPGAWGNMDINASVEVWNFFSRYNITGLIGCITTTVNENVTESDHINIFPNPVSKLITISTEFGMNLDYFIYSSIGEVVLSGLIDNNDQTIDISELNPNIYFLKIGNQTIKLIKSR